ncbi:MAG TPA: iron-containing redox enzyme family protein [Planctomycetota bacterium]|nr:iron-containing redox enzyme family protein [Planctomycetota bacterium]
MSEQTHFGAAASPARIGPRLAFHILLSGDEFPEACSLAREIVEGHRRKAENLPGVLMSAGGGEAETLDGVVEALRVLARQNPSPQEACSTGDAAARTLHLARQLAPTVLVDGCWLQGALTVPMSHTAIGARLTSLYEHAVQAYCHPSRHHGAAFQALFEHIGDPLGPVTARDFAEHRDLADGALELPLLLLSLGLFKRFFLPETVGLTLAMHSLEITSLGVKLVREACGLHGAPLGVDLSWESDHAEGGRTLALEAVHELLGSTEEASRQECWERVRLGAAMGAAAWSRLIEAAEASERNGAGDPRQAMVELIRSKSPHAHGYHLGSKSACLDGWLEVDSFDGEKILDFLEHSAFIVPGDPDASLFLKELVQPGGPMPLVFTATEMGVVREWIRSLSPPSASDGDEVTSQEKAVPGGLVGGAANGQSTNSTSLAWPHPDRLECDAQHDDALSTRSLYHQLVNIETFPEVRPRVAEHVRTWLAVAGSDMENGERPIPSLSYDPRALEEWVFTKHRAQVEQYQPLAGEPSQSKESFILATTQVAPLLFVDGSWLQGHLGPGVIHTAIGRKLFGIFYEEIGGGDSEAHHANIFRALLAEMGVDLPDFTSREFANWTGIDSSAFDVPVIWLGLSLFPRRYMPEILGMNLAVELAGLGASYMGARDIMRHYGISTTFVDLHNGADNVSAGHSARALEAIQIYLDEILARDGREAVDACWQRVWAGLRSTLPQEAS